MIIHFSKRGNRWDSLLFPVEDSRFELTLQFRIQLIRIEPTSRFSDEVTWMNGDGNLYYVDGHRTIKLESWNDLEWETYKSEFKSVLERNWGNRFTLIPNKAWYTPRAGSAPVAASVKCSLSIQLVDSADLKPQFTFRCIHFHPDVFANHFRSYLNRYYGVGVITHEDVEFSWYPQLNTIDKQVHRMEFGQIAVVHEFGHILGFDHVNGSTNDDSDYGVTIDQQHNVMGIGYQFADKNAEPWLRAMDRHLVRENDFDRTVRFTGHASEPQITAYWDNNWPLIPTPTQQPVPIDDAIRGPAGVIWKHLNQKPAD